MTAIYRIAIVGASSLRGKELNEALAESSFAGIRLPADGRPEGAWPTGTGGRRGNLYPADHPTPLRTSTLAFLPVLRRLRTSTGKVLCAPAPASSILPMRSKKSRECWYARRGSTKRMGRKHARTPDLHTPAIVPAHPAALHSALLLGRMQNAAPIRNVSATFLESASEYGRAALDELHQQTVSLLSFQSVPREFYDIQVAFNAIAATGEGAKVNLAERKRHPPALCSSSPAAGCRSLPSSWYTFRSSTGTTSRSPLNLKTASLLSSRGRACRCACRGDSERRGRAEQSRPRPARKISWCACVPMSRARRSRRFWLWASTDNLKLAVSMPSSAPRSCASCGPQGKSNKKVRRIGENGMNRKGLLTQSYRLKL